MGARNSSTDFNITANDKVVPSNNQPRHDIYVDGSVDIIVEVNGIEKNMGTVADTMLNYRSVRGFVLRAAGTAVGWVDHVDSEY